MCKVQPETEPYQGKWSYTKSNEKLKSDGDSCTKEIVQSIHSAEEMKAADLKVMEKAFQNFKSPLKNVLIKSGIWIHRVMLIKVFSVILSICSSLSTYGEITADLCSS